MKDIGIIIHNDIWNRFSEELLCEIEETADDIEYNKKDCGVYFIIMISNVEWDSNHALFRELLKIELETGDSRYCVVSEDETLDIGSWTAGRNIRRVTRTTVEID